MHTGEPPGQEHVLIGGGTDPSGRGGVPYVIPVGGSSALGALGYVAATAELHFQLAALGVKPFVVERCTL